MTGIGKILVFLNLIAAAALLTWGLSAYRNSPDWLDQKSAEGAAIEGEISLLKKEIDRYARAAAGASEGYATKSAVLASAERLRDFRKARLDVWLKDAEAGSFFTLPVVPNDPAVLDTSDAAEAAPSIQVCPRGRSSPRRTELEMSPLS